MELTITFKEVNDMRERIATIEAENASLTAANEQTNNLLDEQGVHINKQSLKIAALTAANESMQEDAVQNTYAFELMLKANKEQDEEIRTLKEHLGAIEIITTHSDYEMSYKTFKAIRAHTLLAGDQ